MLSRSYAGKGNAAASIPRLRNKAFVASALSATEGCSLGSLMPSNDHHCGLNASCHAETSLSHDGTSLLQSARLVDPLK
jgi:hypothetical protein